jgi:hypothetical protein
MFYVCFCHACLRFKLVHIAVNIQQRPLGSHFSVGRRIRCNTGVAIATNSIANSNGCSVQVLLAPYTVFFRLDEVKTCKQKNGNSFYIEVVVKNLLPSQIAFVTFYNLSRALI